MKTVTKHNDGGLFSDGPSRRRRRQQRRRARKARRPGMFEQFRDERQQHRENASPARRVAGTVIPVAHLAYLLRLSRPED